MGMMLRVLNLLEFGKSQNLDYRLTKVLFYALLTERKKELELNPILSIIVSPREP